MAPDTTEECPKCGAFSGDDWSQCEGSCPMPCSPHFKAVKERATELEYLKWFRQNADFGPADGDVKILMNEQFKKETGKLLPKGWNYNAEGVEED